MPFVEARYSPQQLRRNRIVVAAATFVGIAACLAAGGLTSWPWANAFATSGIVVAFGISFWWLFASRKAGAVSVGPSTVQNLKRTFWVR